MFAYHHAQLSCTAHNKTILIMFHFILQTITTAQMLSTGGESDTVSNAAYLWTFYTNYVRLNYTVNFIYYNIQNRL